MSWFTREVLENIASIRKIQLKQIEEDRKKDQECIDAIKRIAQLEQEGK